MIDSHHAKGIDGVPDLLPLAIDRITAAEPKLGKRVRKFYDSTDAVYRRRAEDFFHRYKHFVESQGKTFEFGVDCFVRLQRSMNELRTEFLKLGRYANTSFEDVNRAVYANPDAMQEHMHGLVFAQFLWPDQYLRFQFFSDRLPEYAPRVKRYLEIGGGHGLYLTEAVRQLPQAEAHLVDVSETSLAMAQGISQAPRVQFHWMNVFDFPDGGYDFITMGEVLEHVEDPRTLLDKVRRMLAPGGRAYITTPANAPMVDHIYLFNNAGEIRAMFQEAGLRIEHEAKQFAEAGLPEEIAERMKLPLMFAAFVSAA